MTDLLTSIRPTIGAGIVAGPDEPSTLAVDAACWS
jgi:hypothetical protein